MTKNKPFKRAIAACKLLRKHIAGDIELTGPEIAVYKKLIKRTGKQSLYFFGKYVLGFDKLTEETHEKWADKLQKDLWKKKHLLRMKPRKTFKTTLYGEAFILWLWANVSTELHILYTSANGTLLDEVSAHLDNFLKPGNDQLYTFVYGIERDLSQRPNTTDVVNIKGKNKNLKGSSLMFRTAGGSTNGIHPHIIIVDDPMDKNDRTSEAVRKQKVIWYDSLHPLLMEFDYNGESISLLMMITTRWHLNDLAHYIIEKNSELDEEDQFDIESEGVYLADGVTPRYPEFLPEKKIKSLKSNTSDVFFACQYLNNPLPEGLQIFDKNRLHFYDHDLFDISKGEIKCFLDPSKGKEKSAYPAVIWVQFYNNKLRIFDAIDKKLLIDELIKLAAQKNILYNVSEMLYEDNGTLLFDQNLANAHKEIDPKYRILITPMNEGRNKLARIQAMQPNLYNGSTLFRKDYKTAYPELMNQVVFYPAWGPVDFPDNIEKAIAYFFKGKWKFTEAQMKAIMQNTGNNSYTQNSYTETGQSNNSWQKLYEDLENNEFDYDY